MGDPGAPLAASLVPGTAWPVSDTSRPTARNALSPTAHVQRRFSLTPATRPIHLEPIAGRDTSARATVWIEHRGVRGSSQSPVSIRPSHRLLGPDDDGHKQTDGRRSARAASSEGSRHRCGDPFERAACLEPARKRRGSSTG